MIRQLLSTLSSLSVDARPGEKMLLIAVILCFIHVTSNNTSNLIKTSNQDPVVYVYHAVLYILKQ